MKVCREQQTTFTICQIKLLDEGQTRILALFLRQGSSRDQYWVSSLVWISFSLVCVRVCVQGGKGEPHVFKEKTFKKKRQCSICRQNIDNVGSFCRGKCCKPDHVLSLVLEFDHSQLSDSEGPRQIWKAMSWQATVAAGCRMCRIWMNQGRRTLFLSHSAASFDPCSTQNVPFWQKKCSRYRCQIWPRNVTVTDFLDCYWCKVGQLHILMHWLCMLTCKTHSGVLTFVIFSVCVTIYEVSHRFILW